MNRLGIDVGPIDILIHARLIVGRKYIFGPQGKLTLQKVWSDLLSTYASHCVLKDITAHDGTFVQYSNSTEIFKPKSICFMLGHPHYGAMGEVCNFSLICSILFEIFMQAIYYLSKTS